MSFLRLRWRPILPLSRFDRYATGVNERLEATQRAAEAYRALADLAESVEDEWQYINDLADAYLPEIEALAEGSDAAAGAEGAAAGAEWGPDGADADAATPTPGRLAAQIAAVDEAIAEIALITDPHKAIDWLSTFPHIVALALGGNVDGPAGGVR